MKSINIGIVAHVDAGKTSLTERILFETQVIDAIGRVDHGNTQTDSLELEKKRGITIKSAVVSFTVNGMKVNLIDTPGHADFIAEVERSLSVLDGVILVVSAVEGVQAQTKVLMTVLLKLGIPTIIFVNKIDRMGAQSDSIITQIQEKLTSNVIPLYRVEQIGTKQASLVENRFDWSTDASFLELCIERIADTGQEQLLASYINEEAIREDQVKVALADQVRSAHLYPVYFGSAVTGIGVPELLSGVTEWFPFNQQEAEAPLAGIVFKIEKEDSGEKIAYIRLFSGRLQVREQVHLQRENQAGKVAARIDKVKKLHTFCNGKSVIADEVHSGDLAKVWGWRDVQIGDIVGTRSHHIKRVRFAAPHMETRVEVADKKKAYQLYQALHNLADEDPLIEVIKDRLHQDLTIRIFGEVQKEVIAATLKERYDVDVRFSQLRIVCIEKPRSHGHAFEVMGAADNPFYATVGFRIEPGYSDSGVDYRLEVELGSLPLSFHKAIEETVYDTLKQGLYGWEVNDLIVTLTHTGYASPVTTAGDFRKLVPLVLMEALTQAGTDVYEPIHQFEVSVPADMMSKTIYQLTGMKATITESTVHKNTCLIKGTLPVAAAEKFRRSLHSFTQGEGVMVVEPGGYTKIDGNVPTRARTDYNPLNRSEYLLHIFRDY
ncbi:elongation factor G [Desmospora activa]|uniref:Translation elongation factor 2 (EF-2/EF-G) n=1 Tax=Desmospora activa DSM 45169 TaxID=1121389 RepID=A0A2T4Z6X9_9BACL|nr:TetM/TetW/TetO/TetS family tetracycline resistance ribosomal protection protein [Desmospora activa]PTM57647.1 translation elongation factor 2 (EF-2/EF-G) [Desmospora activa DSM 45169]